MKYELLTEINKIGREKWSEFIYNHPDGNIFQTPEMYDVYESTSKYDPYIFAVMDQTGRIEAILLAVVQKEHKGLLGIFSSRAIVFGGPVIRENNPDVLGFLLKKFNSGIEKLAVYSQFRNLHDWGISGKIMEDNGFIFEEHLNILVDLSKTEEELWSDVHSKRRNEIRRSQKEGVVFSVEDSEEALLQCYSILSGVYSRAKLPIPGYDFFLNLFKMGPNPGMALFCAEYEGEIIGCMIALVFKEKTYDFYAGSKKQFYNKYPNDLIPWEVFLWGKKNGYGTFDFGGAGKPGIPYGVRDYKKKFGGEFVNFGRFEKVHKPFIFKLSKFGFRLWKMVKR